MIKNEEFVEWILSQPDDRRVNMYEINYNDPYGCVMVQYGKDKGIDFDSVGLRNFVKFPDQKVNSLNKKIYNFFECWGHPNKDNKCATNCSNFGELKSLLIK